MQEQDGTQISRHTVHGILQETGQDITIVIGNKVIQRQAGMPQGGRISLGIDERFLQHQEILLNGRILDKAELFPQQRRIAQQGRQQHIMDAQRDLAGTYGLLTTTQEKGNIRCTGADIHDHEAAAGILGSTETEIGAEGRAFSRKGDRRDFIRSRETGLLTYLIRQGNEESSEIFPACFGHFIRNRETPE